MTILPERSRIAAVLALWAVAACAACTASTGPQLPEAADLSAEATAFVRSRSVPPDAAGTGGEVEVRGAVERPGRVRLEPGVETLEQALRASGGLAPAAVAVRVRPGNGSFGKLFAEDTGGAGLEMPSEELARAGAIYLRSGDLVDVASPGVPFAALDRLEEPPTDASRPETSSAAPAASLAIEAAAPQPSALAEPAAPGRTGTSPQAVPAIDTAAALAQLREQIEALRSLMEAQNDAVRREIEALKGEQTRLARSVGRAPAARAASAPPPIASPRAEAAPASSAPPRPEAVRAAAAEAAPAQAAAAPRPATVIVSGSVAKPGVYRLADVKTVGGAVSAAGRREGAALNAVEIRPEEEASALLGIGLGLGERPAKRVVDLTAVASGTSADVPLRGGEVIFVPATSGRSAPGEGKR